MENNTFLLQDTEAFMRGDLDNVTVAGGHILLDMVQGAYVPYGCYTSPAIPLPVFDALRASWNTDTPPGCAVEVQARLLVDGNWTMWSTFGRWSPFLPRESPAPAARGPLHLEADQLTLEDKAATQAQLRIYLYTREDRSTPAVRLLAVSVRALDVIPAGGRAVNARLRLIPYVVARRAPALREQMDLAICLASLTNRWGADLLPEELAQALRDHRGVHNLSFAAAAVGCWGFPAWVGWADLDRLRQELRAGYGVVVALESTPAQVAAGLPEVRYAAVRGFERDSVLLIDPWAGEADFDAEAAMPLDTFLVAWNSLALFMRKQLRPGANGPNGLRDRPARTVVSLRRLEKTPEICGLYVGGLLHYLADDFCEKGGVLAWTTPGTHPHATTAHRTFHFVTPEAGGIRLALPEGGPRRFTVYAIEPSGSMLVGDATL